MLGGVVPMPALLGFPVDRSVYIVDTSEERVLPEIRHGRQEQVVAIGGRAMHISAKPGDGACYFTVDVRDAVTGGTVWRESGINLRTTSGAGCKHARTPAGTGSVVVGVASDGREALFNAYDGRALWVAQPDQTVVAVDTEYALVRSADGKSVMGVRLGRSRPLWTRPVNSAAQAALAGDAVVIVDRRPDRIIVLDPESGAERLNVRSQASVLACGPSGVVVSDVRELGYLGYRLPSKP